jgi:hypothetical protein
LAREHIFQRNLDFDLFTNSPLHSIILYIGFLVFGSTISVARFTAMLVYSSGLIAFLLALLTSRPYRECLSVIVLALAINIYSLSQGRLALTDTVATGLALGSMACWIAYDRQNWIAVLSIVLGISCFLIKTSYLFFIICIISLWFWTAFTEQRDGIRGTPTTVLKTVIITISACTLLSITFASYYSEDHALFSFNFSRIVQADLRDLFLFQAKSQFNAIFRTGTLALTMAAGIAMVVLWFSDRDRLFRLLAERATLGALLMVVLGTAQYGFSTYQPARYYLFTIAPITATAIALVWATAGIFGRTRLAMGLLICAHVLVQVTALHQAADRRHTPIFTAITSRSLDEAMKGFADASIRNSDSNLDPIFIIGHGEAALLALENERIRPLDFRGVGPLCDRLRLWQPAFSLISEHGPESRYHERISHCPEIEHITPVASATIMNDFHKNGRTTLYKLAYR